MLTDGQWAAFEPRIETCRPPAKVAPKDLRQTISAIMWRHQNGAKWRAVPEVLGPWWKAAQTFIRWSRLGVWERLLLPAQTDRIELGMTFMTPKGHMEEHPAMTAFAIKPTRLSYLESGWRSILGGGKKVWNH